MDEEKDQASLVGKRHDNRQFLLVDFNFLFQEFKIKITYSI